VPVTALDRRSALVVIDLQKGMAAMLGRDALDAPVAHAAQLAAAFRARELPVVLVRVCFSVDGGDAPHNRVTVSFPQREPPPDSAEIMDELHSEPTDIIVTKRQPGAFYGTDLDLQLRRRAMTGIVLAGVATSMGVESTARAAHEHGYNVTFAADAMTDPNPAAHAHSLEVVFPRLGEVGTTASILDLLDRVDANSRHMLAP
jgi:nicotinamidase-related amidase